MISFRDWLRRSKDPEREARLKLIVAERDLKAVKKACKRAEKGKRAMKGIRAKSVKVVSR